MKKFIIFLIISLLTFTIIGCCYSTDSDNNTSTTTYNIVTTQNEGEYTTSSTEGYTVPTTQSQENYSIQFVGSINSDVYHYPGCRYVKKIHAENLIGFSSVEEAKSFGYRPCKVCNPPG